MRIVIDCRFWGPTHTGLGVYTKYLVRNLAKIDRKNVYILLVRGEAGEEIQTSRLPDNFSAKLVDIAPYTLAEQFVLPIKIAALKPDLVHFTGMNAPILFFGPYVVTVHDLIRHRFTGSETTTRSPFVYWIKHWGYLLVFRLVTSRARKIIVPSQTVKKELGNRDNIVVSYEAPTLKDEAKHVSHLPNKYAVYTGNAYPHKNLPRLIDAWRQIYLQTQLSLVLVCGRGVFTQRINKLVEEKKASEFVHFLGYLSDEELVGVYRKAMLFVSASLAEGFGLPGLDAMNFGLPVVCSGIPVLREVYGGAAVYFDPEDIGDISGKVMGVIKDRTLRSRLAELGKIQAGRYSWDRTAAQTLEIYESSLGLRPS